MRVVAAKGLRGLTFRAVAQQAGVNNTLIAHHFGSRDSLLAAALEWSLERSIRAADLTDYAADPEAFRVALVQNVLAEPDSQVFQFEMIIEASRRPELQPAVSQLYRRYVSAVAAGLERLGVPITPGLDIALFAALDGLMLQFLSRTITADQFADAVESLTEAVSQRSRGAPVE